MAVTIDWDNRNIFIPQADLTFISGVLYELDVDALRLELKDLEDSDEGMPFPDTHRHNTEVLLSGVTYARTFEVINGYMVEFENGSYTIRCVGANHNLADVKVNNSVSLIIGNSAGLIASPKIDDLHDEAFGEWEVNLGANTLTLKRVNGEVLQVFTLTESGSQKFYTKRVPV